MGVNSDGVYKHWGAVGNYRFFHCRVLSFCVEFCRILFYAESGNGTMIYSARCVRGVMFKLTIEELSEYYKYSAKIKALDDEIKYLRGSAPGLCARYGGSGGSGGVSDHTGNMGVSIAERQNELEKLKLLCEAQRERISTYILEVVSDPLISSMMYARFILFKSWYGVAMYVGGNNTADSCRKAVFRYCGK